MTSRERRIIHLALRNEPAVRSESIGMGPYRQVCHRARRHADAPPLNRWRLSQFLPARRPAAANLGRPSGNMASPADTIVAISTPPGRGGLGIVRLSGAGAREIAQRDCFAFASAPQWEELGCSAR